MAVADVCDDPVVRIPATYEQWVITRCAHRSARDNHSRGEQLKKLFRLADEDPPRVIQVQREHCGSARRRLPDDVAAFPLVLAGMAVSERTAIDRFLSSRPSTTRPVAR